MTEDRKPSVGRIVHFYSKNPKQQWNNAGIGPYAAIVTQVWTDECVNLCVFPNCSLMAAQCSVPYTSVLQSTASGDQMVWWEWPPRV